MVRKTVIALGTALGLTLLFTTTTGCNTGGGGSKGAEDKPSSTDPLRDKAQVVADEAALPACNAENHNNLVFVTSENEYQTCYKTTSDRYKYGPVDTRPATVADKNAPLQLSNSSELPYCNYANEGLIVYLKQSDSVHSCQKSNGNTWRFAWDEVDITATQGTEPAASGGGTAGSTSGTTGSTGGSGSTSGGDSGSGSTSGGATSGGATSGGSSGSTSGGTTNSADGGSSGSSSGNSGGTSVPAGNSGCTVGKNAEGKYVITCGDKTYVIGG